MRCFVAIDVPQEVKENVRGLIEGIRHTSRGVRWVPVENIHVTLKFLGEIPDGTVDKVRARVAEVCGRHEPFTVSVRGTGAFPSIRRPSVLWVGIEVTEEMELLYDETDASLSELGFTRETRKFSPHLTVARVRDARDIEWTVKEFCTFRETFFGTIPVREVLVMQSVLKPTGAEYRKVHGCAIGTG
ncbi:MAG TPA: RNA 2',3'-cyclic phosphodiesterase [Dissulfurispiraceae bacterium]|nr:RNA 2',3'-cyclic phosphodiesterase [Dissulfurispiraceae bacterium]